MSDTIQNEIAAMAHDIRNGHVIDLHNARELAQISQYAHSNNMYDPRMDDNLARVLKHSIEAGVYRRTSLPTPVPGNYPEMLRRRV